MDIEFVSHSKGFRKKRIVKYAGDIEPHEALLDRLAQKKEEEIGMSEKKLEVPLSKRILSIFFVLTFLALIFLFVKSFQLQVLDGNNYSAKAQENKFIVSQIQAERGVIYDQNMSQLVYNEPAFALIFNKSNCLENEKYDVLKEISQILGVEQQILDKKINESENNSVIVAENINHETLIVLETKINDLPGFEIRQNWIRNYRDGRYFADILGYLGQVSASDLKADSTYLISDKIGKAGLEKSYESTLKKNPGKLQIERDALGQEISRSVIEEPASGNSLVLWLDSDLQKKITDLLEDTLKNIGAKNAVAVALDPKTGGVLALVSLPNFDNNLFQKGADPQALQNLLSDPEGLEPLFNRAISGRYLTGSTIKPFIASGALEENIISPDKKIYDGGSISVPNQYNPEIVYTYTGIKPHGWVDMREAIAVSSNIYFYTVGGGYQDQKGLGPTNIKNYLNLFGWGEKTGIDLPGEKAGFVPDANWKKTTLNEGWWDGDTYNMSIGQGYLQITPLEVANSFAAIANGGTLYKPKVVKEIIDNSTGLTQDVSPEIIRSNFIDAENLQVVREGMRLGVTGINTPDALLTRLNSLPVSAAAKTGTAQLGNGYNNNWISVFAPYDDPQISLTIVVQNVKGLQAVTVPLARDILEWYFSTRQ